MMTIQQALDAIQRDFREPDKVLLGVLPCVEFFSTQATCPRTLRRRMRSSVSVTSARQHSVGRGLAGKVFGLGLDSRLIFAILLCMSHPTTQDFADFYAGRGELRERPADPGDFRFDIIPWEEPDMGCTHTVRMIDDRGVVVEQYTTDDPYGHIDQFRRYQSTTFEDHFAPFGPAWQEEMRDAR